MNIAILSDIHGNHIALEKCLDYLNDKDIDAYCFLGNYTGEFPGIEQTMKILYEYRDTKKCYFIRGNKENYVLDDLGAVHPEWDNFPSTVGMLRYAHNHLTEKDIEFFNSLPITMTIKNDGMPDIVICHGSPRKINEKLTTNEKAIKEVANETESDYIICGHTHSKADIQYGTTCIWNPGSVGTSIDEPYGYQFMIIHEDNGEWAPEFISLEADIEQLVSEMRTAGLYETAPYWTRFTELMIKGKNGKHTHGTMLSRAMDICYEKHGKCDWPMIPVACFEEVFEEIVS